MTARRGSRPQTVRLRMDMLDYPTAWAIQKSVGDKLKHHARCSSVPGWDPISGPAFLCDCGAVKAEWERLRVERVEKKRGKR